MPEIEHIPASVMQGCTRAVHDSFRIHGDLIWLHITHDKHSQKTRICKHNIGKDIILVFPFIYNVLNSHWSAKRWAHVKEIIEPLKHPAALPTEEGACTVLQSAKWQWQCGPSLSGSPTPNSLLSNRCFYAKLLQPFPLDVDVNAKS